MAAVRWTVGMERRPWVGPPVKSRVTRVLSPTGRPAESESLLRWGGARPACSRVGPRRVGPAKMALS
jgi:hypothetical protein